MVMRGDELAHGRQRLAHKAVRQVKAKAALLRKLETLLCERKGSHKLGAMETDVPQATKNVQSLGGVGCVIHQVVGPLEDILTRRGSISVDCHHGRTEDRQEQQL